MTFPNAAMSIWADTVVSRWLPPPGSEWLLLVWVAAVGACFGSFMNVVIYRLPAGLSIVHPGSRCPQCGHAIRGFDNIPVLSWMILRGRCRDCGTSIATRYPTVEAFVALVATALALVDLFPDWVGLVDDASSIDAWNSATPWLRWAGHLLLGCTLICASLIEFDGHVVPWRLFLPAGLAGAAALVVVPLATDYAPEPRGGQDLSQRLVSHGIGLIVAVGCGLAIASLDRRPTANWTARCLPLILACVVIEWWLGWPATLVIAAGTSMVWIATRVVARAWPAMGRTGTMTSLTMTTLLILFATHWLVHVLPPLTAAG